MLCRQRPGTAKGFLFLSLEDETGVANAIVMPDLYTENRSVIVSEPYLLIDGILQNQQGVIHVKAKRIAALPLGPATVGSRDFH